jgi:hypothetical protein
MRWQMQPGSVAQRSIRRQLLRSTPDVPDCRLNVSDHRFDQARFSMHRRQVLNLAIRAVSGPMHAD